jgi:hypothetical protein
VIEHDTGQPTPSARLVQVPGNQMVSLAAHGKNLRKRVLDPIIITHRTSFVHIFSIIAVEDQSIGQFIGK